MFTMVSSINFQKLIGFFCGCLLFSITPFLFFIYLYILATCTIAFGVVSIVDFFEKSSHRKKFGSVLVVMILAAIANLFLLFYDSL